MTFRAEAKTEPAKAARVRDILESIKPLAAEYYELTGKPLGVTGEIGEAEAARIRGLDLAPVRTKGYLITRQRQPALASGKASGWSSAQRMRGGGS
jgi:hypothetical protein